MRCLRFKVARDLAAVSNLCLATITRPGQVITPINMGKKLTITLESLDLGQLVERLQAREEAWQKTADFMESGYSADDSFVCEECTDADEATRIANYYGRIIRNIEEQVSQQGGL